MNTMLHTYHRELVQHLDHVLEQEQELFIRACHDFSPQTDEFVKLLTDRVKGGKRLRALFIRLGYQLYKTGPEKDTILASLAYEVFQTSILIHDDIIDRSPLRRGIPTIHTLFPDKHYGMSQAIALADLGYFWSLQLFQKIPFPAPILLSAQLQFLQAMSVTCLGEILDVDLAGKKIVSQADLETVHHLKTGIYTVVGPLKIGAILAQATPSELKRLEALGYAIGLAFQIRDDVIGIYGDDHHTGKSSFSDIEEGKKTHLLLHALEHASAAQHQHLTSIYGQPDCTAEKLQEIRLIFKETGALQASEHLIKYYTDRALEIVTTLNVTPSHQQLFKEIVLYLAGRSF